MLLVGLGGFVGANARYLMNLWVLSWAGSVFPWGTLLINVTGSFLLAAFIGWASTRAVVIPEMRLLFATGFCGAYTTFSTFATETIALLRDHQWLAGLGNLVGTNALCLIAVLLGLLVGSRLSTG
jgi:CrcB protein